MSKFSKTIAIGGFLFLHLTSMEQAMAGGHDGLSAQFKKTFKCASNLILENNLSETEINDLADLVASTWEQKSGQVDESLSACLQFEQTRELPPHYLQVSEQKLSLAKKILTSLGKEPKYYLCHGVSLSVQAAIVYGASARAGVSTCITDNYHKYPLVGEASISVSRGLGATVSIWSPTQIDRDIVQTDGYGLTSLQLALGAGIHASDECSGGEGSFDIDCGQVNGLSLGVGVMGNSEYEHLAIKFLPRTIHWKGIAQAFEKGSL